MNLNLKQLQAFVWVADLASFRRAADRLNTTQPNISARIAGLETLLGTKLMDRDAGSVRLTAKGRELLVCARRVLDATEALVMASGQAALVDGILRLGVTEMVVHTWLRDFLKELRERFPKINVELTVDMSVNLENGLAQRSLDLALQNGPFGLAVSGSVELGGYPLVWVASPGLNIPSPASPADMAAHPILTHARDSRLFQEVTGHFADHRDLTVQIVPSSNLAACLHMTVEGMGIATVPRAMISKELARGELVEIAYPWAPEALQFAARYDAEKSAHYVASAALIAGEVAAGYGTQSAAHKP